MGFFSFLNFGKGSVAKTQQTGNSDVANMRQSGIEASTLTPPPLPKAPTKPQGFPGYRTQVIARTSAITKPSIQTSSLDRVAQLRAQVSDYDTLRTITKYSPELSSSISLSIRTAISEEFTLVGRDLDGQVDPETTALAHELLRKLTFMGAADGSFGSQMGLQSLSETLALDLELTGAMGLEVALDKAREPASFNPIAIKTLIFYEEENSFRVAQKIGGEEVDLDIPTFIYVAMDQAVTEAYPTSPLVASIQPVLSDLTFNNDMRKALQRAVLPRLTSTIDTELFRKNTPPEILADPEAYAKYQNETLAAIENTINGLNPEDALISFDFVTHSYIEGGHDPSAIIQRVQEVLNAKLVSGAKTLPVALGFSSTGSASSAESLLFLKHCDGIRRKLNEIYSRALTVAVRLMGRDAYVEFAYAKINLRPDDELEAFRAMKQSRVLQLLSLGFATDEEASLQLTGHLPPQGFKPLSGTMFMDLKAQVAQNPTSNTANATEKNLTPDTPTEPKTQK